MSNREFSSFFVRLYLFRVRLGVPVLICVPRHLTQCANRKEANFKCWIGLTERLNKDSFMKIICIAIGQIRIWHKWKFEYKSPCAVLWMLFKLHRNWRIHLTKHNTLEKHIHFAQAGFLPFNCQFSTNDSCKRRIDRFK